MFDISPIQVDRIIPYVKKINQKLTMVLDSDHLLFSALTDANNGQLWGTAYCLQPLIHIFSTWQEQSELNFLRPYRCPRGSCFKVEGATKNDFVFGLIRFPKFSKL